GDPQDQDQSARYQRFAPEAQLRIEVKEDHRSPSDRVRPGPEPFVTGTGPMSGPPGSMADAGAERQPWVGELHDAPPTGAAQGPRAGQAVIDVGRSSVGRAVGSDEV